MSKFHAHDAVMISARITGGGDGGIARHYTKYSIVPVPDTSYGHLIPARNGVKGMVLSLAAGRYEVVNDYYD